MVKLKHSLFAATTAIALLGAASIGYATDALADTAVSVEKAQTPADHAAIAKRYEKDAADYEKQAAKHEGLAAKYQEKTSDFRLRPYATTLAAHCDNQAKRMKAAAAEAREMAQLHGDVAQFNSAETK